MALRSQQYRVFPRYSAVSGDPVFGGHCLHQQVRHGIAEQRQRIEIRHCARMGTRCGGPGSMVGLG